MGSAYQSSGIHITEVRVRNFRSIKKIDITLNKLTLLIGPNNSGKTSFLDALFSAIGAGRKSVTEEDVYLAPHENKVPKERKIIVDILIKPTDSNGVIINEFEEDNYWLSLWGKAISMDDEDNEFVAIRTESKWSNIKGEFSTERKFLADWITDSDQIEYARIKDIYASHDHLQPLALYFMDAKRDIHDELQNRGSFWHKLVSDPGLADEHITDIENTLSDINQDIINNSDVFRHIQQHLNDLYQAVSCDRDSVEVTPVSRTIRNLSKGIGVTFATKDSQSFPLDRHGMGTRSLAALLTFRAYTTWKQKNTEDKEIHPMLALEEPESHLHPQAQRSLFKLINDIPGQRIVSTHSPYIVGQSSLEDLRHFRKDGSHTIVQQLDMSGLDSDDIRKIERMVMNTRGELLYARALVFAEGDSEEQALPVFAQHYWNRNPIQFGISFIGVGGAANYLPFLRLATSFNIPWYILSDGEQVPVSRMQDALSQIGITNVSNANNIFILPNQCNYESYLLQENYDEIILNVLDKLHGTDFIDKYIKSNHGKPGKKNIPRNYNGIEGRRRAILDAMGKFKTRYALPIANAIVEDGESIGLSTIPPVIQNLLERMSLDLDL